MNPQPPEYVGSLFALVFIALLIYYTIKAYIEEDHTPIDIDNFIIGYVEESQTSPIVNVNVVNPKSYETTQMFIDCVDALHALGMKKSAAKRKVREVYEQIGKPPESLQEFLIKVMKH